MTNPGIAEAAFADLQWLRRFATVLAQDADDADDLVQETLVAAWAELDDERASSRPWLSSVLRNRFQMLRRGRSRRERREHESTGDATEPSLEPEREVARLEVLRALLSALEVLPAEDQSIVLRRFFDGDSAADIARDVGVPAATIRSRIRRALGRLRDALDRSFAGREAWCVALGTPSITSADGSTAAATSEPAAKGASMSVAGKVALCVGIAGIGGGIAWAATLGGAGGKVDADASTPTEAAREADRGGADAASLVAASTKAEWERRRERIRAALSSADRSTTERVAKAEERKPTPRRSFRPLVDACLDDLGSKASGALTLEMVEIGAPDVGVIYESVKVLETTVDDEDVLRCVVESMYAYVDDPPTEAYERTSRPTMQVGTSSEPDERALRMFDAVVGAHINEVRFCEGKAEAPGALAGTVAVEISIAKDGTVSSASPGTSALPPAVIECIVGATKRWKFPGKLADMTLAYEFVLPIVSK